MRCAICGEEPRFRWTDYHGIAACKRCGATYLLYHYENDKRVDREPELTIDEAWVPLFKRYWEENQRNCNPGAFNMPGSSYEVASREDFEVHRAWFEAHRSEWPVEASAEAAS
jgi:predicted  nucleic acid-binding Zn-ribbon protein